MASDTRKASAAGDNTASRRLSMETTSHRNKMVAAAPLTPNAGMFRPGTNMSGEASSVRKSESPPKVLAAMIMASSQNLPAVLNDPKKGKQRDFFTRSWGDSFVETRSVPISNSVFELPSHSFDKYLKKVRRYESRHLRPIENASKTQPFHRMDLEASRMVPNVDRLFLDPSFDLTKEETFSKVFQMSHDKNVSQQLETAGKLIQERLSFQLDEVEVSIAGQVAQRSHNFFQIMTYHEALMTQVKKLVALVRTLRSNIRYVDESALKPSLSICQLVRRNENMCKVLDKLSLMSFLHQTQPTIQQLLTSSEFSGALDLITTSCEILAVDLRGIVSFRHLSSQLHEIQHVIGRMLLQDFQTFIAAEIGREITHVKATALTDEKKRTEVDSDQLKSVILGLLRQNSFTFLEALEDASVSAIKETMKDVCLNILMPPEKECTLTALVADFARNAASQDWIDLFDVLIGTLIVLLHRIHIVHQTIVDAIKSCNEQAFKTESNNNVNSTALHVPDLQLQALLVTNKEVLINICDQMHERCAKLLTQRSKLGAASLISTQELTSIGLLISIFAQETIQLSGKHCTGLVLSLHIQAVMYSQNFDEEQRQRVLKVLEQELWRKASSDLASICSRLSAIPSLRSVGLSHDGAGRVPMPRSPINGNGNGVANGMATAWTGESPSTGNFLMGQEAYSVIESVPAFLAILVEYCNLCSMLPVITLELGLKAAELVKFFNSRVCQLILGAAAINVSGLKTITIRNLAIALRSIQFVSLIVPYVLLHFQSCYGERDVRWTLESTSTTSPRSEGKQMESLQRQFEQAVRHLKNHVDELYQKIVSVVETIVQNHLSSWQPATRAPSATFKALCKQLAKLHESVVDIWPEEQTVRLFGDVNRRFLAVVQAEIRGRSALRDPAHASSRTLLSELIFYGQSILRLKVLEEEKLSQERFEELWKSL